jgi:cysteine desulfuration protein SufE
MERLDEICATFRSVDRAMRLEMLLDFARKLPEIPPHLAERRDAGLGRVHECVTPLFLWLEPGSGDALRLHIDVAEEAPTVRGFAGLLVRVLDGEPSATFDELPDDLIERLGLHDVIRMNRRVGIAALIARIRRDAAASLS